MIQAIKPVRLFEQLTLSKFGDRIDRDKFVVHNVKIQGLRSANSASVLGDKFQGDHGGYEYSPEALKEALPLYEGVRVNLDHPPNVQTQNGRQALASHRFADRFGRAINVHFVEGQGIYGDLEYLQSNPQTALFLEAVERMPETIGLSVNGYGRPERMPNGKVVITKITRVRSVDLIGETPATTSSLFESEAQMDDEEGGGGESQTEESSVAGNPPTGAPAAPDTGDVLHGSFKTAIESVLDDATSDIKAKVKKIKAILVAEEKALAAVAGGGEDKADDKPAEKVDDSTADSPPPGAAAAKGDAITESLKTENAALRSRLDVALLEAKGVKATPAITKAVAALTDEADKVALIESLARPAGTPTGEQPLPAKKIDLDSKPRSVAPLVESLRHGPAVKAGDGGKLLAKSIRMSAYPGLN